METGTAYGHWGIALISIGLVLGIVWVSFRPRTKRDWRTFGTFGAFIVALFAEMYGFPLTIYLLYGWLVRLNPDINWLSHDNSHLLQTIMGWEANAHFGPVHLVSNILLITGLIILAAAWRVLYRAQRNQIVAISGPYEYVRHPQYVAFTLIMISFLIQWPTIPTLIMFPIMLWMYYRLAIKEEKASLETFGQAYEEYMQAIPRFFPRFKRTGSTISTNRFYIKGDPHEDDFSK